LFDKKLLVESYVLDLGSYADAFQKISVIYEIIDNLDSEERKKLRAHLETLTNKKIPFVKFWKGNTENILRTLIDLDVKLDEDTTYENIKEQIKMR
jgi:hypothetical protein